jgi:hypothetical protein
LARYCFEEGQSQQKAVAEALDEFLTSYGY